MQKYFLYLFALAFIFSSCGKGEKTTDEIKLLARKWDFNQENHKGNFLKLASSDDSKKFEACLNQKDTIHGYWEYSKKKLTLVPVTIDPFEAEIDSVITRTDSTGSAIIFYSKGDKELSFSNGKLQNHRVELHYQIDSLTENRIQFHELNGSNEAFVLTYTPIVHESQMSAQSIMRGLLGILFLLIVCWLLSSNRGAIKWRLVLTGLTIQFVFAVLVLKVPFVEGIFESISSFFVKVVSFAGEGATFLFKQFSTNKIEGPLMNFVVLVLPTIIFFSALTTLLFYFGILQRIVWFFAWLMKRTMRLSGSESVAAAGNIFLGQTEAPLLVRPYIEKMTKSEILCLMAGGMATIAGGVLAAYVGFLGGDDPQEQLYFAKHLLAASVMSAPAAIVAAKMLLPETEEFNAELKIPKEKIGANALEAIANGTTDGVKLAVNVAAMLLVFIALIAMCNFILKDLIGEWTGLNEVIAESSGGMYSQLSFEFILGNLFAPVAWMLGVCWEDSMLVGQLMGEKTIINEFYAYTTLGNLKNAKAFAEEKSAIIATYILCGFSNFASIGIQIGGIGALAPNKKPILAQLGFKALIAGTIACLFTAVIVGMLM
jgi:CNT family concentrative nucleoside transporter